MAHVERRHVRGGGDEVVHEAGGQELAVLVVNELLKQRTAHPLRGAAHHLPLDDHGIDLHAAVVDDGVAQELHGAGLDVDLHHRDVDGVGPGDAQPAYRGLERLGGLEARGDLPWQGRHLRVGHPGHTAHRQAPAGHAAHVYLAVDNFHVLLGALQQVRAHPANLLFERSARFRHRRQHHGAEPCRPSAGIVGRHRGVPFHDLDGIDGKPGGVRGHLRRGGGVAGAAGDVADEHLHVARGVHAHGDRGVVQRGHVVLGHGRGVGVPARALHCHGHADAHVAPLLAEPRLLFP